MVNKKRTLSFTLDSHTGVVIVQEILLELGKGVLGAVIICAGLWLAFQILRIICYTIWILICVSFEIVFPPRLPSGLPDLRTRSRKVHVEYKDPRFIGRSARKMKRQAAKTS